MIRKARKITKQRGTRTNGGGCSKKRRGAGHRGGVGQAGLHKHHWSWTVKFDPKHFGKYGFKRPQKVIKAVNTVNLGDLVDKAEKLLNNGIAIKENDAIVIDVTDLGFNKVLGKGKVSKPLTIKAPSFTALATKKIEESGGEAIVL